MELHHPNPPEPAESHKRFQAAVDVIQNLPKHGSFRPSYEVMLRFYSLYKQAMFGPCRASRPGFWDPVGRYKWDAWNQLGDMSCECAMTAYVDEMKKVAQEVIDKMPMNEKTASFFHYFEPLYHVIHDMPRPPEVLLSLRPDINGNKSNESLATEVNGSIPEEMTQRLEEQKPNSEPFLNTEHQSERRALSDALVLTSDSESEIFCDSVEQLDYIKQVPETYCDPDWHHDNTPASQVNQLGAGQGGEGAEDGHGFPLRRREQSGEEMRHGMREPPCDLSHSNARRAGRPASGAEGGGDSDGGDERFQDPQVQQQIMLALRRLRDDMRSVIERLEVLEGLAAANAQDSQWRTHRQFTVPHTEVENWWPFDVSGRTLLLLLIWPFIAQGIVFFLRQKKKNLHH